MWELTHNQERRKTKISPVSYIPFVIYNIGKNVRKGYIKTLFLEWTLPKPFGRAIQLYLQKFAQQLHICVGSPIETLTTCTQSQFVFLCLLELTIIEIIIKVFFPSDFICSLKMYLENGTPHHSFSRQYYNFGNT